MNTLHKGSVLRMAAVSIALFLLVVILGPRPQTVALEEPVDESNSDVMWDGLADIEWTQTPARLDQAEQAAYVAPTGPTEILGAGAAHTCALTQNGNVICWGRNNGQEPTDGVSGPYTQVSAGGHTCALTSTGAVDCWGENHYGQAEDQTGPYTQVSAGAYHTCALTPAGAVDCWGEGGQAADQPGTYTEVSAGFDHTCALTPEGAVDCWGSDYYGQSEDQAGPYTQVSTGFYYTCALTPEGAIDCWGTGDPDYDYGQSEDQVGPYSQVSAGDYHTCALTPEGAIDCWGYDDDGQAPPDGMPGHYTQVDSGSLHTCALTPDGAVDCWGWNLYGQAEDQPGPYGPYNPYGTLTLTKVTDPAGATDFHFALSDDHVRTWGSEGSEAGQLQGPHFLVIDGDGNLLVADSENDRIQKFSPTGQFLMKFGTRGSGDGQFKYPKGVALDGAGNIYVADHYNHRIQKFDHNGVYLAQWGTNGSGDGQFKRAGDVVVGDNGRIYTVDHLNHRVQVLDMDGNFIGKWGSLGSDDGQFDHPMAVALDSAGNVYVSDRDNNRIQKFDSEGNFLLQWGSEGDGDGQFHLPHQLTVDSWDRVWVTDRANDRVQWFDSSGNHLGTKDFGYGSLPDGIVLDNIGNVYVAEFGAHRIRKSFDGLFSLDGGESVTLELEWAAGHYALYELVPDGWDYPVFDCEGSLSAGGNRRYITLGAGEDLACTVYNTQQLQPLDNWAYKCVDCPAEVRLWHASLALDTQGLPVISYYDRDNKDLKIAWQNHDGGWRLSTVDSEGDVGWDAMIAIDQSNETHIVYSVDESDSWPPDGLKYARERPNGGLHWEYETVIEDQILDFSFALDAAAQPHIVYMAHAENRSNILTYTYKDATGWHNEFIPVAASIPLYPSLAVDSQGRPHVSYLTYVPQPGSETLVYAYRDAAGWHSQTVDSLAPDDWYESTSLTLDSKDSPHIAYLWGGDPLTITYATLTGTGWQKEVADRFSVPPETGAERPVLALGPDDRPHITYVDVNWPLLRYGTRDDGRWRFQTLEDEADFGPALVVDQVGRPHLAYTSYLNVRYAVRDVEVPVSPIELTGLEVTQAVQDLTNDVELVADKTTYVRAHVSSASGNTVSGVKAALIGRRNGAELPGSPLAPTNLGGSIDVLGNPERQQLSHAFNFRLPPEWTNGEVEVEFVGLNQPVDCQEVASTANDCKATVTFLDTPRMSVSLIGIRWKDAEGNIHDPDDTDYARIVRELESRYPIDELDWTNPSELHDWLHLAGPPDRDIPDHWSLDDVLGRLANMRELDGASDRIYYGVLVDHISGADTGLGVVNGWVSASFKLSLLNAYAHEIGHNLGRRHAPCMVSASVDSGYPYADGRISAVDSGNDAYFGFVVTNEYVVGPNNADFMSYCPLPWVSDYTYEALRSSIVARWQGARNRRAIAAADHPVVLVSGSVSFEDGAATLNSLVQVAAPGDVALPEAGGYSIRFEGASRAVLATYPFEPAELIDGGESLGSFSMLLPWDPATQRVVLLHGSEELASQGASGTAPSVSVTSPQVGDEWKDDSETIAWEATDGDGDKLHFTLQYSVDNGATWQTLSTDYEGSSYSVDRTKLPGGSSARVRVLAVDGFHTASDSTGPFSVVTNAPKVSLEGPSSGAIYVENQSIYLEASAHDAEDGELEGQSLTWASSLDGTLGAGKTLVVNASDLQEGDHEIELVATDSDGQSSRANVSIQVHRLRPVLPKQLVVAPEDLWFAATAGGDAGAGQTVSVDNLGDGVIEWTASVDRSWIELSKTAGTSPDTFVISVDATQLQPGEYEGEVTVVGADSADSPQTIRVILSVHRNLVLLPIVSKP